MCIHIGVCVCVANDVGQGCYGAMKVRDAFANAYRELRDAVLPQYQHVQSHCSSFLGRILLVPQEVVKYRQVIEKRWQLWPCSSPSSSSSAAEDTPLSYCEHQPAAAAAAAAALPALLTQLQLADDKYVTHTHTHTHKLAGVMDWQVIISSLAEAWHCWQWQRHFLWMCHMSHRHGLFTDKLILADT